MVTLVIPLGDFKDMFIVNTLGILPSIPFGVLAQVPLSTTPSTLEVLHVYTLHGGITAGITVGEGVGLLLVSIQCVSMHAHTNCCSYM